MRVVALVSGGKDSCYNMMQCVRYGHEIVALANLRPSDISTEELDSYMYQTVGHQAIEMYSEAMNLPLFRESISGTACSQQKQYVPTEGDEVEDSHRLLARVRDEIEFDAVSVGAILSDYQRIRVENICSRLGVTCLSYLWQRDQQELLQEMIACQVRAIVIKVASLGLLPKPHLGQSLSELQPHLLAMEKKYGLNVCGEGGEYETFTLDCPLFRKKIVVDEQEVVIHSNDAFAPVGYLRLVRAHLEDKAIPPRCHGDGDSQLQLEQQRLMASLPMPSVLPVSSLVSGDPQYPPPLFLSADGGNVCTPPAAKIAEAGSWLYAGPVVGLLGESETGMTAALKTLKKLLRSRNLNVTHVASLDLFVSDLSIYGRLNGEYRSFFDVSLPPVRVCVQTPLPPGWGVMLCGSVWRDGSAVCRRALHVQSLSHWAPANIGPYSQTDRCGDLLHVAGMIGLEPATLRLVRRADHQARLALRHAFRVLQPLRGCRPDDDVDCILQCVCYVTESACSTLTDSGDLLAVCRSLLRHRAPRSLYVAVSVAALPRGASVEWQLLAHVNSLQLDARSSCMRVCGVTLQVDVRFNRQHHLSATCVNCSWDGGADVDIRAEELAVCLRASVGCLKNNAGAGAACRIQLFYSRSRISLTVATEAVSKAGLTNCVVNAVPVISLENGLYQCVIVGLSTGADRVKMA